ncbi:MAG: TIGR03435 family protein [Bryobacteraceae bacterium]
MANTTSYWSFHARVAAAREVRGAAASGPPQADAAAASDASGGGVPSIFTAVERQLGLKLEKVKDIPVDVVVIDHLDKVPTEN